MSGYKINKIVVINNYDSFTYNIAALCVPFSKRLDIFYNDGISIGKASNYDIIVISSGPYTPQESGNSYKVTEKFLGKKPILGVCLGHQIIGTILGFTLQRAKKIIHGDRVKITHFNFPFWKNIPEKINVVRYNSLAFQYPKNKTLQKYVSSITDDKEVMSIENDKEKFLGVQFHPDSFLASKYSRRLIKNFFTYL